MMDADIAARPRIADPRTVSWHAAGRRCTRGDEHRDRARDPEAHEASPARDVGCRICGSSTRRTPVTTLYNQAQLETPWEITNVNGGAVPLGHPYGTVGHSIPRIHAARARASPPSPRDPSACARPGYMSTAAYLERPSSPRRSFDGLSRRSFPSIPRNSPASGLSSRAAPKGWARPSCGVSLPPARRIGDHRTLTAAGKSVGEAVHPGRHQYPEGVAGGAGGSGPSRRLDILVNNVGAPARRVAAYSPSPTTIGGARSTPNLLAAVGSIAHSSGNAEAGIRRHHPYLVHSTTLAAVRGDACICGAKAALTTYSKGLSKKSGREASV